MRRFSNIAGFLCLWLTAASFPSPGQSPGVRLPSIPSFPGIEAPASNDHSLNRAIGAVDRTRLEDQAELLSLDRIWDQAPHNAFTDLIRFRERWYCSFREGARHVSPDGAVRVITSADGVSWNTAFYINSKYADMRDPKLSITPDNRIMLSAMAAYNPPTEIGHQTLAWYSLDGREWGMPFKIGDPELWLWNVSWHRGSAYSMAYSTLPDRFLRMYVGPGGLRFRTVQDRVIEEGKPSEATILFNSNDSALCLLRRDGGNGTALAGISRPPYRGWDWHDLGLRLGGPALLRLPDGRVVAAGRRYEKSGPRTVVHFLNEKDWQLREFLELPSSGDNGYPGLVFHEGVLWVSYYSSHEGKAAIYLAKVRLPKLVKEKPVEIPDIY